MVKLPTSLRDHCGIREFRRPEAQPFPWYPYPVSSRGRDREIERPFRGLPIRFPEGEQIVHHAAMLFNQP